MKKRNHPEDNQPKNVPWEIDRTEKKKKVLRIIFLILAVAAAIYMCIGIYFGLTGKNEYFQYEFWSVAFRKVWVHPRWFLHSVAAGMALILCLYGYYRTKSEKKHYVALGFCMLIPYFGIGLLTTGAPLLICMIISCFFCDHFVKFIFLRKRLDIFSKILNEQSVLYHKKSASKRSTFLYLLFLSYPIYNPVRPIINLFRLITYTKLSRFI